MSHKSPSMATQLTRKQLIRTECWRDLGASGDIEVSVEQSLEFVPQEKDKGASCDFYVDFTTQLIGKTLDKEVIKIASTFRGDYNIIYPEVTVKSLKERNFEFAAQFFLAARDHTAYLLTQMGLNHTFLPFSIHEGQDFQKDDNQTKEGTPITKRKSAPKRK